MRNVPSPVEGPPTAWMARPPLRVVKPDSVEGSPYPKCSLLLRGGARVLDGAVAYGLALASNGAGPVVALLWVLLADGLFQGQSLGKRLCGVKAIHVPSRTAARYRESVLRNAPFGLVILLSMLPQPLGSAAFVAGAVVIGGVEAWKVWREPLGLRLGDFWADTQVVDGKVVIGQPELSTAAADARVSGRILRVTQGDHAVEQLSEQSEGEETRCGLR